MVFVAVRQEHAAHLLLALEQVAEVGMQELDAVIVLGEGDAAVDDEQALLRLQGEAIHADLAEAAERDDA